MRHRQGTLIRARGIASWVDERRQFLSLGDGARLSPTTRIDGMSEVPMLRQHPPDQSVGAVSSAADDDDASSVLPLMALSIPLMALLIPLLAVAGGMGLGGVVLGTAGTVVVMLVIANLVRGVLRLRHRQRLELLTLQLELTRLETAKLAEVNRIVD
jgi:hypothetical protein